MTLFFFFAGFGVVMRQVWPPTQTGRLRMLNQFAAAVQGNLKWAQSSNLEKAIGLGLSQILPGVAVTSRRRTSNAFVPSGGGRANAHVASGAAGQLCTLKWGQANQMRT